VIVEIAVENAGGLVLRPRTDEDRGLLAEIYASTRREELAVTGWSEAQMHAFLTFQFDAQDKHYTAHYKTCGFYVIELDGTPCGRLYIDEWPNEVRIVDISFLADFRGRGLGTKLLRAIVDRATEKGLPVSIHVEKENPALRLYERLGFTRVEERGAHFLMQRSLKA
jgi:ribosomal protein S18 acetylase RimI-like enzyme